MTDEQLPPKKSWLRAFWPRLSTPAWAAVILAIFLWIVVIGVWSYMWFNPHVVPGKHALSWNRILLVIGLTIIVPIVFYYNLRFWLEGESSRFPDLDRAWNAGVRELNRHGISLETVPVYLIMGSSGRQMEQNLMAASGMNLRVRGVPEGPAPLRWYASSEAIYLVCCDVGWLSALNSMIRRNHVRAMPGDIPGAAEQLEAAQVE